MTTLSHVALGNLQTAALRTRNLPLFDQVSSELHNYDGSPIENHRVIEAVATLDPLPYRCPLCWKHEPTFNPSVLTVYRRRGYCTVCWTSGFKAAKSCLLYLDAALGQGFKQKALQFAPDAPQRVSLRAAYRKAEAIKHALQTALDAAEVGLTDRQRDMQKRGL